MSNKSLISLVKAIASLDGADQCRIIHASDDDLPKVLEELGLSLPSSSLVLRILKILLYAAGIFLAGYGTSTVSTILFPSIF